MSEVMMGFYEAVIEWHPAGNHLTDDPGVETEVSPAMTEEAARHWLSQRIVMNDVQEGPLGDLKAWKVVPLGLDSQHRTSEARDGGRWCYYWLRPSSQMSLL